MGPKGRTMKTHSSSELDTMNCNYKILAQMVFPQLLSSSKLLTVLQRHSKGSVVYRVPQCMGYSKKGQSGKIALVPPSADRDTAVEQDGYCMRSVQSQDGA